MIRVLFVDDEPAVLEGLENRLRGLRRKWKMTFVAGVEDAWSALLASDFDVVVTDMRMPGLNGDVLLHRIHAEQPHVVRIVLSGHAGEEGVLRALPAAHRFLEKPCEAATLETAVEGACSLQAILSDIRVRQVVGGIERLPSLPRLYQELSLAFESPDTDIRAVASILEQDPTMTARVLQVVNSAASGLVRSLADVQEAAQYLGLNALRSLVLSVELFAALEQGHTAKGFSLSALQDYSFRAARIASRLLDDKEDAATAFSAAMLHDIGALVMATSLPAFYESALALSRDAAMSMHAAETDLHGFTHADVGAYLLSLWGLPYAIVEAVAFHHQPGRARESKLGVVGAVHVATCLARAESGEDSSLMLDMDYLRGVGALERVPGWAQSVGEAAEDQGRGGRS